MLKSWLDFVSLSFEAQRVIYLRSLRLASGGPSAVSEGQRMVSEKMFAAFTAGGLMALGAGPERALRGYRQKIRANARRLSR